MGWWLTGGATSLVVWWALRWFQFHRAAAVVLLLAAGSLAAAWYHQHWNLYDAVEIGRYSSHVPRPGCLCARAIDAPKIIPAPMHDALRTIPVFERTRLVVRVEAIRDGTTWKPATGLATLLMEGHLLGVHAGDRLEVYGRYSRPLPANNPGEFDFALWRRTERQLTLVRSPYPDCVTVLERGTKWNVRNAVAEIRSQGSRLLWTNLDRRRAGLAAAVLLGERERLEYDRTEAFVETGTIHLLAISGLHVGILVSVLMLVLRLGWMRRSWALTAIGGLTIFYAVLTDARPPVVRAAVLIVILCVAMYTGRRQLGFNTLAAAAIVVLIWNPANLFRVGTQLSFLAVATLVCFSPEWVKWQSKDALDWLIASTRPAPERAARALGSRIWRLTLAGLVIWMVALPLVMYHFHLVSPVGVILTPILFVPIAAALFFGLGVLVFGWLLPPLAMVCGWVCDRSLDFMETVVTFAQRAPGSFAWVAGPPVWWIVVFYVALGAWAFFPRRRPPLRWCAALMSIWIVMGIAAPAMFRPDDRLRCTFVAVGHGCSVLLELPDGKTILYDAGKAGSPEAATRGISSVLWTCGHTHVDALIVSHADADHFNAIPDLLQRFSVGVVYVSPVMRRDTARTVEVLFDAIDRAGVPIRTMARGDRLATGDVTVEVLHPSEAGVQYTATGSIDNSNSIVLAVEYQGKRVLLTGDLEGAGLAEVVGQPPFDCDVLLAPHHGSVNSRPADFAAWSCPEWTIVGSGISEPLPIETREAYGRGERRVLRPAESGAVTVVIQHRQLAVAPMRNAGVAAHRSRIR